MVAKQPMLTASPAGHGQSPLLGWLTMSPIGAEWNWRPAAQPLAIDTARHSFDAPRMAKLPVAPLSWVHPDRRRLYRALAVLASTRLSTARAGVAKHALLNDLEIYDDPRQGIGAWLFPDEVAQLEVLGEVVKAADEASPAAHLSDHQVWRAARQHAESLLQAMDANGPGPVPR